MPPRRRQASPTTTNQLRIIAGKWRSRRLAFPDQPGLRPTGDRVRETLFNWLAPYLPGATCLDAFAGSGALGFEALSRGAKAALFLESNPQAVRTLKANKASLEADDATIKLADTLDWLNKPTESFFDIVFVDPPFNADLHNQCLTQLLAIGACRPDSLVYVEYGADQPPPDLSRWSVVKEKRAGRVGYLLLSPRQNAED